eukprot:Lithocolla_globosa_v1_NODE_7483_length_941_cov_19.450339.p2 type:complete len:121 gc:universal NODE_7483_length_941_cov_19.450339:369-731(+)
MNIVQNRRVIGLKCSPISIFINDVHLLDGDIEALLHHRNEGCTGENPCRGARFFIARCTKGGVPHASFQGKLERCLTTPTSTHNLEGELIFPLVFFCISLHHRFCYFVMVSFDFSRVNVG